MDFNKGIKDGIPIALGYFSVSIAFGIMAVEAGCTWFEAVLISLTNLTSAGQFAGDQHKTEDAAAEQQDRLHHIGPDHRLEAAE